MEIIQKVNNIRDIIKNEEKLRRRGLELHELKYSTKVNNNDVNIIIPFNTKEDKDFILDKI